MMIELVLVEGVSDVQLISYYLQNVYGWKYERDNILGTCPEELVLEGCHGKVGGWRQHCVVLCQVLCAVCAAVGKSTDSGARFPGSAPSAPTSSLWVLRPVCELLSVP